MARIKDRNSLPQPFLVNLVSQALFYWDVSPALAIHARPDQDAAWQVAVAANTANMQKSDMATIVAICVNLAGRPSRCLVNNVANVARAVALSHAIGLNHDCSEWKMSDMEKRVRWKAWWGSSSRIVGSTLPRALLHTSQRVTMMSHFQQSIYLRRQERHL